jgi:pseudouridine-5'-phosphate glycosidase
MQQARPPLDFSPEVEEALESKLPIVALESTIITHGTTTK